MMLGSKDLLLSTDACELLRCKFDTPLLAAGSLIEVSMVMTKNV